MIILYVEYVYMFSLFLLIKLYVLYIVNINILIGKSGVTSVSVGFHLRQYFPVETLTGTWSLWQQVSADPQGTHTPSVCAVCIACGPKRPPQSHLRGKRSTTPLSIPFRDSFIINQRSVWGGTAAHHGSMCWLRRSWQPDTCCLYPYITVSTSYQHQIPMTPLV